MSFSRQDLTRDRFLDGRLTIFQPRKGYRAGVDPVLLAAAVDARAGDEVLELGCGTGVASLCLAKRVSGVRLTGIELQRDYADLARRNAAENDVGMDVICADISDMPECLRAKSFDHVFANPPYFRPGQGTAAQDGSRDIARAGATALEDWISAGTRRLKPGGWLTVIQKADRLMDLLRAFDKRVGSISVKPLSGRAGRAADRVIVVARKGGRGRFRLLAPMILHEGDRHERDADSYRAEIKEILRDVAPLKLGD